MQEQYGKKHIVWQNWLISLGRQITWKVSDLIGISNPFLHEQFLDLSSTMLALVMMTLVCNEQKIFQNHVVKCLRSDFIWDPHIKLACPHYARSIDAIDPIKSIRNF